MNDMSRSWVKSKCTTEILQRFKKYEERIKKLETERVSDDVLETLINTVLQRQSVPHNRLVSDLKQARVILAQRKKEIVRLEADYNNE